MIFRKRCLVTIWGVVDSTGIAIVGPLPTTQTPPPASLITDAVVSYQLNVPNPAVPNNTTTEWIPLSVDDQKSGWVDPTGQDVRYCWMSGVAIDGNGAQSRSFVTPSNPSAIASVEGVYIANNPTNFYDPSLINPYGPNPMAGNSIQYGDPDVGQYPMIGTVDSTDLSATTIIPSHPERIARVLSVMDGTLSPNYNSGSTNTVFTSIGNPTGATTYGQDNYMNNSDDSFSSQDPPA